MITLEVHETNLTAQLVFKAQGFEAVRVLRGYYEDSGEDAYYLCYRIPCKPELPCEEESSNV